jgi:hypothetical protein
VAHADEVRRELPKETGWVRFHMTEEWEDGTKRTFQFEVHVFAPEAIGNQPCRWFELKIRSDESKPWSVFKWRIPEEEIRRGGTALAKSQNAWRKPQGGELQKTDLEDSFVRLNFFVPPPLEGAKLSGEKGTVDWQQGKLECQIATLQRHDKFPADETDIVYRVLLHPQVPMGVAGAKLSVTDSEGVKGTIEYSLLDMGTNAKSELPDVK